MTEETRRLVEATIRAIEREPKRFEMNHYHRESPCGTVHCLAGWMMAIRFGPWSSRMGYASFHNRLSVVENMIGPEADKLFLMDKKATWSWEYLFGFDKLPAARRAKIAARVLRGFLETGKVNWSKAGFKRTREKK